MFLVDVHDFEKLPKANKRVYEEDDDDTERDILDSPSKKQKLDKGPPVKGTFSNGVVDNNHVLIDALSSKNTNHPFTLPAIIINDDNIDIANDIKMKLGEVFKRDDEQSDGISYEEVKSAFAGPMAKYSSEAIVDIPLDQRGQTALHFASTLASLNLVSAFIQLGLNSPIRGNIDGESPLISCIQVTNSMEKGTSVRFSVTGYILIYGSWTPKEKCFTSLGFAN